jgi:hypothetical protein
LYAVRAHNERNINKLTTMKQITISDMNAALKVGAIPVQLVRRSGRDAGDRPDLAAAADVVPVPALLLALTVKV